MEKRKVRRDELNCPGPLFCSIKPQIVTGKGRQRLEPAVLWSRPDFLARAGAGEKAPAPGLLLFGLGVLWWQNNNSCKI